ncbi:surfeit locus protein 1 [Lasioglossum baleicum]|uniref:surfeit locus protein 1 n=1 Tax=Lasioglossum baleicum TaxID=434251 RepID=UPI003FCE289C
MHLSRTIFTRLGKQFQVNLVQFVNRNRSSKSCDAVNIQKRFKTRLSKPNLYVGPKKPTKFYELPESIGPYGFFLLSIPIGTFLLGTWQVQRRKWKLNLLQNLNDRIYHEPLELPADLEQLGEMEYYPFKVKGTFLYDQEFPIGLRSLIVDGDSSTQGSLVGNNDAQRGYYIITPFKLSDRDLTILVNRGWVPRTLKNSAARQYTQVNGEVEIIGVLRLNESRPQFVPKNSPQNDLWYYRDVNAMAEIAGTAPVYLDMKSDKNFSKYPIGSQTNVKLRNEHLSYIITWYSLSAVTAYMWYKQIIKKIPI